MHHQKQKKLIKVKVSSILVGRMLGNGADLVLGSQLAGDRMHDDEYTGGLPPPHLSNVIETKKNL